MLTYLSWISRSNIIFPEKIFFSDFESSTSPPWFMTEKIFWASLYGCFQNKDSLPQNWFQRKIKGFSKCEYLSLKAKQNYFQNGNSLCLWIQYFPSTFSFEKKIKALLETKISPTFFPIRKTSIFQGLHHEELGKLSPQTIGRVKLRGRSIGRKSSFQSLGIWNFKAPKAFFLNAILGDLNSHHSSAKKN